MSQVRRDYMRLVLDVKTTSLFRDDVTGSSPDMWRGNNLAINFAVFIGDELADVSIYSQVTCEVKHVDDRNSNPLMKKSINGNELNQALTLEQWDAGTDQHGTFLFDQTETNLRVGDQVQKKFWIVIHCIDNEGNRRTLGGSELTVIEDGVRETADSDPPEPEDPGFWNKDESDARYVLKAGDTMTGDLAIHHSVDGRTGLTVQNLNAGSGSSTGVQIIGSAAVGFVGATNGISGNGEHQLYIGTENNYPVIIYQGGGESIRIDANYITFAQGSDVAAGVRIKRGVGLQIWDRINSLWRTLLADNGIPSFDAGESP